MFLPRSPSLISSSARRWVFGSRMDIDPHIEDDDLADLRKTIADLIKRKYEARLHARRKRYKRISV